MNTEVNWSELRFPLPQLYLRLMHGGGRHEVIYDFSQNGRMGNTLRAEACLYTESYKEGWKQTSVYTPFEPRHPSQTVHDSEMLIFCFNLNIWVPFSPLHSFDHVLKHPYLSGLVLELMFLRGFVFLFKYRQCQTERLLNSKYIQPHLLDFCTSVTGLVVHQPMSIFQIIHL